jgi:predicted metalloprotease with PDZ domain
MIVSHLRTAFLLVLSGVTIAGGGSAQQRPPSAAAPTPRSAPISNVRYEVTFDSTTARSRLLKVAMTFDVGANTPVVLSLPAWTPGAYDLTIFARKVVGFAATANGARLDWDKADYDTWRIAPAGNRSVTVSFDYVADSLDNAMAWSKPDFVLFNGTNVFLYPEGQGFAWPATVTVKTESGWKVATGMHSAGAPNTFREGNYHDLVDMPFFVGNLDVDSLQIDGRWNRLATYPAGTFSGRPRTLLWDQLKTMVPAMARVVGETPWDNYTTMLIFESSFGGGSALEHQSSHVGIYHPQFAGTPILASITAHEIFHAWNVKRMRPADMVPYIYERSQPTPWLWVSEGITDYYADLALSRGGVIDTSQFLALTNGKIQTVASVPPVALEDASLSTWAQPSDGTGSIYYPKGSLAGFLLDIMIRDASDNSRSLDDVMRTVYTTTYKKGRGFGAADWWGAVSQAAGGKSFADFNERYIDGREEYPWATVLPLAGLRLMTDSTRIPRFGTQTAPDSATGGLRVVALSPGGVAEAAGVQAGDVLIQVGTLKVDQNFGPAYRQTYAGQEGADLPITVQRNGQNVTLNGKVKFITQVQTRLGTEANASEKAVRIRNGIIRGTTGR